MAAINTGGQIVAAGGVSGQGTASPTIYGISVSRQ
jgi:hypothetical protein